MYAIQQAVEPLALKVVVSGRGAIARAIIIEREPNTYESHATKAAACKPSNQTHHYHPVVCIVHAGKLRVASGTNW